MQAATQAPATRISRDTRFPATARLAAFAAALSYDGLPAEVRARMPALLADYFRVGAVGVGTPWLEKIVRALRPLGGKPTSSILYSDRRTDVVRAAYINGVIAGSLEWDDTHVGAMLHPGVVVWPAALAVGELVSAPATEIIAAAAAGYEVMIRIGLSVQPSHFERGFQSTATCGVFGAATAAAKLLGMDADGIRDALGIAASYAGGTTQFFLSGSEVKRLHAAKASAAGVEAALFAQSGLTGPPDIIEGHQGFARAFANRFDPGQIETGLGDTFHLMRLQLKPHAASARVLAAIEAATALAEEGAHPDAIDRVEIGIPKVIQGRLTNNDVRHIQQTQMSVPFAVAMALHLAPGREKPLVLALDDFAACFERADVHALSRRTECVLDPSIEAASNAEYVAARVTLRMRDGSVRERSVLVPAGSPERPMTLDDIAARFRVVARDRIPAADLDGWLEALERPAAIGARELMGLRLRESPASEERRT